MAYQFRVPPQFRAGYIRAGRVNTYAEIIPVNQDGIAVCHSLTGKAFLENHGFIRLPDVCDAEPVGTLDDLEEPEQTGSASAVVADEAVPRRGRPPRR